MFKNCYLVEDREGDIELEGIDLFYLGKRKFK